MTEENKFKTVLSININEDGDVIRTIMKKNEETGNWEKGETYLSSVMAIINTKEKQKALSMFIKKTEEEIKELCALLNMI